MKKVIGFIGVVATLGLAVTPALAAPVTHNVTALVNTNIVAANSGLPSNPFTIDAYPAVTYGGLGFTLNDGDTIEVTVTTTGPGITLNDLGYGLNEALLFPGFGFNAPWNPAIDNPGGLPVLSYDRATTVTVTGFSGDLQNSVVNSSLTNVLSFGPSIGLASGGNYTDSTVILTSFTMSTTFTNFVYQPGFEYLAGYNTVTGGTPLIVLDEFEPVPAPGALALFGLGLLGFGVTRRKKAA